MIKVNKTNEDDSKFEFLVEVNSPRLRSGQADGKTKHQVTVDKDYYSKLTSRPSSRQAVEDLVKRSFEFLLERESNQSILKEFNLKVIQKYFPEFESTI